MIIEDKNLASSRPVIENQVLQAGDEVQIIKQQDGAERNTMVYSISFSKTIFLEEDVSKNCKKYPNREFETYKECDDLFILLGSMDN